MLKSLKNQSKIFLINLLEPQEITSSYEQITAEKPPKQSTKSTTFPGAFPNEL
jgi:hypothetical protein